MVPLNFNNQKHFFFFEILNFSPKQILINIISGKYSFKKFFLIIIVLLD